MDNLDRIIAEHLAEVQADLEKKARTAKRFKPGDIVVDDKLYRPVPTDEDLEVTGKRCPFCNCKRSAPSIISNDSYECKDCGALYGSEICWQPPRWASHRGVLRGIALLFGLGMRMEASDDIDIPSRKRRVR